MPLHHPHSQPSVYPRFRGYSAVVQATKATHSVNLPCRFLSERVWALQHQPAKMVEAFLGLFQRRSAAYGTSKKCYRKPNYWWSRWEALPLFTRNNLAFGDASFYFGNAKHPVAVPGSIIRPDAAEGKCSSAYYEVLGLVSRRSPARQQSMSGGEGGLGAAFQKDQ